MKTLLVITGTTRGLGAALHELAAKRVDNEVISISRAHDEIGRNPNIHADFGDVGEVEVAIHRLAKMIAGKEFSRAILINNAGVVMPVTQFDQLDGKQLASNVAINVVAPMLIAARFAALTHGQARERLIVNISSGAAKRAVEGWSAYCASKAALEMATRVAALEAERNDPTLAICSLAPGVVDTDMQQEIRGVGAAAFPEVAKFQAMKADGVLRSAADVARDILNAIAAGKLTNGGNFDLRSL